MSVTSACTVTRFRRQLVDSIGHDAAHRHGPATENDFLVQRACLDGSPAIWAGFVVTSTLVVPPDGAGTGVGGSGDDVGAESPAATESGAQPAPAVGTETDGADLVMVGLLVGVTELPPLPQDGVISPAAAVSRVLKARHGRGSHVHLLDYDGRSAAAVVHASEVDLAGAQLGGEVIPAGTPPVEQLVAEVHVLFPEAKAMVTVTAATMHPPSLDQAVLLAGTIAQTVRLRETP